MVDIIIDIETLGTKPGCPILEIGACAVDHGTGEIYRNFSRKVRCGWLFAGLQDLPRNAGDDMGETVRWWLADPGRADILKKLTGTDPIEDEEYTLAAFVEWFADATRDATAVRVWGNGPTFDLSILLARLALYGIETPWHYTWERCVRTALEMANYEKGSTSWVERGPRHRALNDARHEARKLYFAGALGEVSSIMKRLRQRYDVKARQA
jgi:exodeoxyribonuclease VIII